jgi:hypothetical protein
MGGGNFWNHDRYGMAALVWGRRLSEQSEFSFHVLSLHGCSAV